MKQSLTRLIIDTATAHLYVGLYHGNDVVETYYHKGNNDHSVKLMTEIKRMFESRNLVVADLDEIIVGIGPGSYTGLRIGVTVAKMFGWNNNIPVKTVSSLALLASSYQGDKWILAEMDARRGNSFLGVYKNTGKGLEMVFEEQLTNLEEYKRNVEEDYEVISVGEPRLSALLRSDLLHDVEDIHQLNPNYLRKTEAERNKENS